MKQYLSFLFFFFFFFNFYKSEDTRENKTKIIRQIYENFPERKLKISILLEKPYRTLKNRVTSSEIFRHFVSIYGQTSLQFFFSVLN